MSLYRILHQIGKVDVNIDAVDGRLETGCFLDSFILSICGTAIGYHVDTNAHVVGGMDVPLIRKFACGYAQGVKAVNPDATVISNMTGTTPAAWNDPVKGSELTKAQISQGADVIYAAAGGTGVGVLQTAADEGILSIGVDSNQNHLHPGKVLTSMLKRVDVAVYNILMAGDDLEVGKVTLDLSDDGVGYAMDEYNAELITDEMQTSVEEAKAQIIAGDIKVHNYTSDDSCPVLNF